MEFEMVFRKSWTLFWAHIILDIAIAIGLLTLGKELGLDDFWIFFLIVTSAVGYLFVRDLWYQFGSYLAFTEDGVLYRKGVIANIVKEIPFDNIDKIEINQGALGRVFRFGDIILYTGSDQPDIEFFRADKPQVFKKHLHVKI